MWESPVTQQQLRQSISHFRRLNEVPGPPKKNTLVLDVDLTRHLTVEREKDIASNLAFLSSTSDDSQKVIAACVEEYSNGEGITIRIASNSGDLSEVTNGFQKLAVILEQAAQRENPKSKDLEALLQQVVALDRYRILSRLRSRHVRTRKATKKQALITQLNQAIYDDSSRARSGFATMRGTAVRDVAKALQTLFARLEIIMDPHVEEDEVLKILSEMVKEAVGS